MIFVIEQLLEYVENIYGELAGFGMIYDEYKKSCRDACKDEHFIFLFFFILLDKKRKVKIFCYQSRPETS